MVIGVFKENQQISFSFFLLYFFYFQLGFSFTKSRILESLAL